MKIFYISPSTIPSRSANLIHVLFMAEAFSNSGCRVFLFLHSEHLNSDESENIIRKSYGISDNEIDIVTYKSKFKRGRELGIAISALAYFIKNLISGDEPKFIISRNIYGAFFLGLLMRRNVVYETHSPEKGFRGYLQNSLISSKKIQTVVISDALKKIIIGGRKELNEKIHVFHDAARAGRLNLDLLQRKKFQRQFLDLVPSLNSYEKIIGYFGHLYSGRGIDIIQGLAKKHPNNAFIVYGGNEKEIQLFLDKNLFKNLFFMGHISQNQIFETMAMMDILLMPYQRTVSIGLEAVDTAKWMSPMKMFEYMSAAVPIISSDLPVLREVLVDLHNCILVEPENIDEWSEALKKLSNSAELNKKLSSNSYNDYLTEYTWDIRAQRILVLFPPH